jgi:hypothetical protein
VEIFGSSADCGWGFGDATRVIERLFYGNILPHLQPIDFASLFLRLRISPYLTHYNLKPISRAWVKSLAVSPLRPWFKAMDTKQQKTPERPIQLGGYGFSRQKVINYVYFRSEAC